MMNPFQIAQQLIQQHPELANNPNAQHALQILASGDQKAGEEFAKNYLNSMGLTQEQAIQMAQQRFGGLPNR